MSMPHRYLLNNHAYHVASVTRRRIPMFRDHLKAQAVIDALHWLRNERAYLLAYVVMPDHFHALIVPKGDQTISRLMQSVKGYTARLLNGDQRGALWQQGFYERIVRNEMHLREVVRYVHDNPVVAGLVEEAEDYTLSSAGQREHIDLDLFL